MVSVLVPVFKFIDDLLDYLGDENQMGKNTGNDFFEKKITLPIIHAYEQSSEARKKIYRQKSLKTYAKSNVISTFY